MKKLYLLFLLLATMFFATQAANTSTLVTDSVKITFQVDMSRVTVSPEGVHMNGSWGNWGNSLKMEKWGSVYSKTILLHPGDTIRYKFVNGAAYDWGSYENPVGNCSAPNDYNNRILVVPATSQVLKVVCYNECSPCLVDSVDITFMVNMSKVAVSDSGVHMNGSWANWSKPVRMAKQGYFHVATLRLHPGDTIQYKYMNGGPDNWRNYENPIGSCSDSANYNNRFFIVPPFGMVLDPVCFNECLLCFTPNQVNVTFRVDMSKTAVSDSGVWVNGAWSGWSKPERLQFDGKYYSATVPMHPGDSITYKFVNSGRFDWMKYENPQGPCTIGGAFDRFFRVPFQDLILDPVCYNECSPCLVDSVDITFMVNMSKVAVSDTGVFINGSWGNWASPVKLVNMGPIFFGTLKLHPGDTIRYKYMNGSPGNWRNYENPTGACADAADYNNRVLVVPNGNILVGPYCFNECNMCLGSAGEGVFDDWYYYGADQVPAAEHWTEQNTGLGLKPSIQRIDQESAWNNVLVCQSDSLHQSQVTYGSKPTSNGPFTLVVRAKSDVSDGTTLGGFFEINPGADWPNMALELHSEASNNRYVSLSYDGDRLVAYPIDIRAWHTYWVTLDGDSLRLYVDEQVKPVFTTGKRLYLNMPNASPYAVRMLSPDRQRLVTGDLDFISWKMGEAVAPSKFLPTALPLAKTSTAITAYPNPTNGKLRLAGLPDENVAVTLYDASGKLLNTFGSANVPVYELDLAGQGKGLYLINVQTTTGKKTFKILKF